MTSALDRNEAAPLKHIEATQATNGSARLSANLHSQVLDSLGLAICEGTMAAGSIVTIEILEERLQVSRTVIREALRVLTSMGLVTSRRRVGIQILPLKEWNLYDPQIIRWRLASSHQISQLRSLTELRSAIEPEAARLAAQRAPLADASELIGLAGKLWAAGSAGDGEEFLRLDIMFHQLILRSSGNEMFSKLHTLIDEVLAGRTDAGLMPQYPHKQALQWHTDVANAIQTGNSEAAGEAMLHIMRRALSEMSTMWEGLVDLSPNRGSNTIE
ncbi:FadR/GntR family transcriptional regulator [Lysinibacter cavernae]|uniref:DNA-binding FadR family transcriptional regulator n=1 Tax=Lysinibacter cavernae TaxID=1640652 RepID=A0A7X5QYF5_9MICO|nr:FadR/GntR family transcriptional regulator [Lysinibacter cavernae]NIH52278.1 DNA-binding FadR family transcriptional regulator [Lysinibacter cavernae]